MRYIGSKTKLLDAIDKLISARTNYCEKQVLCDLFTGTGVVADYFKNRYKIISNDNLFFCHILAKAKTQKKRPEFKQLGFDPFVYFNTSDCSNYVSGYCYNTFAPAISGRQYFSDENAKIIDFIRDTIEQWSNDNKITKDEYVYLLASLLESISKISNVAGVYAAYLHIWDPRAVKKMQMIPIELIHEKSLYSNDSYFEDASVLIKKVTGDILYLDPPYTPTQYISQYHVLETIAKNDHPTTHGVGAHRDNGDQISLWSKKGCVECEFERLIANAQFRYIILSYSDAGIMSKSFIEKVMKRYAKPGTFYAQNIDFVKYKNTRALNREIADNTSKKKHFEWLFFIEKNDCVKFESPLNYIGGKYDALDFLLPNFPEKINKFYDLFGGGGTVAINVFAKNIIYNDVNFIVSDLLAYLGKTDAEKLTTEIRKIIKKYNLQKGDKESYYALRTAYNSCSVDSRNPLYLYLLIAFGFEHQIRFNSKLEFNNPVGNSGFNDEMFEKLISFSDRVKNINIEFKSYDYRIFEETICKDDFVYCDPPYLLTRGAYNDGKRGFNGWDEQQQQDLLAFLTRISNRGAKFVLSSVLEHKGIKNDMLLKWANENNFYILEDTKLTLRNRQDRREAIIKNF